MVLFTKSPTGRFLLAYSAGDRASLAPALEDEIVAEGYGTYVTDADASEPAADIKPKPTKKK